MGYRYIGLMQIVLTIILFISLPLWVRRPAAAPSAEPSAKAGAQKATGSGKSSAAQAAPSDHALSLAEIIRIPGAREVMITFFCYCAVETTTGLWASSFLVLQRGMSAERAASFAGMFYLGITIGRAISGFLTLRFNDTQMIRLGISIIAAGVVVLLLPLGSSAALVGLILIGLGCAPVYPCIIHSTPARFGADRSQAIIGVQMASAYVGTCLMPPIFGLLANAFSTALLPYFLGVILLLLFLMHERLLKKTAAAQAEAANA